MFMQLVAVTTAQNPWIDPAPTGRWAAPTATLAKELLPPDWAADAVEHEVERPLKQGGPPHAVRFYGRPTPTGDGFCVRNFYGVNGFVLRPGLRRPPYKTTLLRLGDCEGIFAHLNPGTELDDGKRVLRWLAWARTIAAGNGPLPIALRCADEDTVLGYCLESARTLLARLPLAKTYIISKDPQGRAHHWDISIAETTVGRMYWDVKINATGGAASIFLGRRVPAPF